MSIATPLWKQLLVVWAAALLLAALLLALESWLSRGQSFLWLAPYPTGAREALALVGTAFRAKPLVVSAVVLVPTMAILASLALIGARLAAPLWSAGRAG